jgi:hypothetical protein
MQPTHALSKAAVLRLMQSVSYSLMVIVLLSLSASQSPAQILQPNRYERHQKNSDDYFNIINLKEHGLALFRERDKYKNSNKIWELIFLDSTLQEVKSVELEIKERHKMIGYEISPGHLYFLFRTGETTKNDFELIDVSFAGEELARYAIKPDLDFKLSHFIKTGDNFIFGGYVNSEPAIILFEQASSHLKVIPGFFQKDTELVDLRTNLNQTFNTVLVDRSSRDNRKLVFRTFDETGKMLLEDIIPIEDDRTLQSGITSTLEREDLVIIGTWNQRNSKQSNGFFATRVDPFSDQKIEYINFGLLNHFVDYLNPKRAQRIKENSKEDVDNGRVPNYTAYVTPFKITEHKEGFLLLAEVYNPVSNISAYNTYPYYYNPFYYPYGFNPYWPGGGFYYPGMSRMYRPYTYGPNAKNADEFKTLETVLVAFNNNGKVIWDESIKLDEVKLSSIEQVADFSLQGRDIYFIYKKESELKIKKITLDSDLVLESTEKIKPSDDLDEIRSDKEYEGGVRHWFGNSFYVWGYQTIRNVKKEDRIRDVFYINKVYTP